MTLPIASTGRPAMSRGRAIRKRFSTSNRTKAIVRGASCCIELGTAQSQDVEVFAEDDPAWFIGIEPTRLGRAAIITLHGHDASEARIVDLDDPTAAPRLIAPRRPGFRYEVMDHGDCFYIRTNAGAPDFKIVVAPREAPHEANWRDLSPIAMDASSPTRRCSRTISCS